MELRKLSEFWSWVILGTISLLLLTPAKITSSQKINDPADQCVAGIHLFETGEYDKALTLLEIGFYNRDKAIITADDGPGRCAFLLGYLYSSRNNNTKALDAYRVALEIFSKNGDLESEEATLNNISLVYYNLGQYVEALDFKQQAMAVAQKRAGKSQSR